MFDEVKPGNLIVRVVRRQAALPDLEPFAGVHQINQQTDASRDSDAVAPQESLRM